MELTNDFRVGVSVPDAWKVLTDVERIAPLLPGAELQEVEGEEYRGVVKVKVGPITAQYKGKATFVERDEAAGRVVLRASGRDTRGQGNASAVITATMTPDGDVTHVSVATDLTVTGKVAQFGRGVLAEVSGKLIGQFVDALEADLARSGSSPDGGDAPAAPVVAEAESVVVDQDDGPVPASESPSTGSPEENGSTAGSQIRQVTGPPAEPVDLLAVAGRSTLKRVGPAALAAVIVLIVLAGRRRARTRRRALTRSRAAGRHQVGAHVPSHLSDLGGRLGDVPGHLSDAAGHVSALGGHVSDAAGHVSDLGGHLSDVGGHISDVAGHASNLAALLPEVRVRDLRSAAHHHRG
jgi:carbon monoxide dehydrogenase subunit G